MTLLEQTINRQRQVEAEQQQAREQSYQPQDLTSQKLATIKDKTSQKLQTVEGRNPEEASAMAEAPLGVWKKGTVKSIVDGDGVYIEELGDIENRIYGYDAAEVPHPGEDNTKKEWDSKRNIAEQRGVPLDSVSTEDVYEQGAKDTMKALYFLTKKKGDQGFNYGDMDYYRKNAMELSDLNIPVEYQVTGKGVFGRNITLLRNPNTGEVIQQYFTDPTQRMGFPNEDAQKITGVKTKDYIDPFLAPSPGAYGSDPKFATKPKNWDTMNGLQKQAWNDRSKESQGYNQSRWLYDLKSGFGQFAKTINNAADEALDYSFNALDTAFGDHPAWGKKLGNSTFFEEGAKAETWQDALHYNPSIDEKVSRGFEQYMKNDDYSGALKHLAKNWDIEVKNLTSYIAPRALGAPAATMIWALDATHQNKNDYEKATGKKMSVKQESGALAFNVAIYAAEALIFGHALGNFFGKAKKIIAPAMKNPEAKQGFEEAAKFAAKNAKYSSATKEAINKVLDVAMDVGFEVVQEETENVRDDWYKRGAKFDKNGIPLIDIKTGLDKNTAVRTAFDTALLGVGRVPGITKSSVGAIGEGITAIGNTLNANGQDKAEITAGRIQRDAQTQSARKTQEQVMKMIKDLEGVQTPQEYQDVVNKHNFVPDIKARAINMEEVYQKHKEKIDGRIDQALSGIKGKNSATWEEFVQDKLKKIGAESKTSTEETLQNLTNEQKVDFYREISPTKKFTEIPLSDFKINTEEIANDLINQYAAQEHAISKKESKNKGKNRSESVSAITQTLLNRSRSKKEDTKTSILQKAKSVITGTPAKTKLDIAIEKAQSRQQRGKKTNIESELRNYSTKTLIEKRNQHTSSDQTIQTIDNIIKGREKAEAKNIKGAEGSPILSERGVPQLTGSKAQDIATINAAIAKSPTDGYVIASIGDAIDTAIASGVINKIEGKILHTRLKKHSNIAETKTDFTSHESILAEESFIKNVKNKIKEAQTILDDETKSQEERIQASKIIEEGTKIVQEITSRESKLDVKNNRTQNFKFEDTDQNQQETDEKKSNVNDQEQKQHKAEETVNDREQTENNTKNKKEEKTDQKKTEQVEKHKEDETKKENDTIFENVDTTTSERGEPLTATDEQVEALYDC